MTAANEQGSETFFRHSKQYNGQTSKQRQVDLLSLLHCFSNKTVLTRRNLSLFEQGKMSTIST